MLKHSICGLSLHMSELLFEIYSEEIPARFHLSAQDGFRSLLSSLLAKHNIVFESIEIHVTPCRVVFAILGLNDIIASERYDVRGPKISASKDAIGGFCKSHGITEKDLLIQEHGVDKCYYAQIHVPEVKMSQKFVDILPAALLSYVWPKSMYWGRSKISWVRPIRNVLAIFDGEVLDLALGDIKASNFTFGHKFINKSKIVVNSYSDYLQKLSDAKVFLSIALRREVIESVLHGYCEANALVLNKDEDLLNEVIGLAEYPFVLMGDIPDIFMDLPEEVLITSMRHHQKYFTMRCIKNMRLANKFAFVTNLSLPSYKHIIAGNEKVLNARLSDALYFYNEDLKKPLSGRLDDIHKIIFHEKYGTLLDKIRRLHQFFEFIYPQFNITQDSLEFDYVRIAISLCKCDLTTQMVIEFPELQGVMGYYYAKHEGFDDNICQAIKDHYLPIAADDKLPDAKVSVCLSLIDKLSSLVMLFLAGERATGSKDQYGLRRYAIAIIRLIIERSIDIDLYSAIKHICSDHAITVAILRFVLERFKYYLRGKFDTKLIDAVADNIVKDHMAVLYVSLCDICTEIKDISSLSSTHEFISLLTLYKRANSIVGGLQYALVRHDLLEKLEERELYSCIKNVSYIVEQGGLSKMEFLQKMLDLIEPSSKFFDNVLVNSDDIAMSNNRKAILLSMMHTMNKIMNFSSLM